MGGARPCVDRYRPIRPSPELQPGALVSRPARPRRSVLFMPASNARALEKAKTLPADALVFVREDAVAPHAKGTSDLTKDLHARHTRDRHPLLTSLSLCVLAARAHG